MDRKITIQWDGQRFILVTPKEGVVGGSETWMGILHQLTQSGFATASGSAKPSLISVDEWLKGR